MAWIPRKAWQEAGKNNRLQGNQESVFPAARPDSAGCEAKCRRSIPCGECPHSVEQPTLARAKGLHRRLSEFSHSAPRHPLQKYQIAGWFSPRFRQNRPCYNAVFAGGGADKLFAPTASGNPMDWTP